MANAKKPVKLQLNNSGAWKNVVGFDADDDDASCHVMAAAEVLGRVDSRVTWRVIMSDASQTVLMYWTPAKGWHSWKDR